MASETDTYVFEIRSGLYRGVTHDLDEGRHVIGRGTGADLVLMEPGLADEHAAITLQGERIRIEGLADGVVVDGAGPVPPGAARTVRLPAVIDIAGIETVWRQEATTGVETRPNSRAARLRAVLGRPAVPGIAAASVLALTIVLTIANPIAGAAVLLDGSAKNALARIGVPVPLQDPQPAGAAVPAQPTAAAPPPSAEAVTAPVLSVAITKAADPKAGQRHSKETIETAAASLKRQVEQAGLLNVHVGATGGAVSATGFIEPSMAGRWESLQKDFDEHFVGEVTLVNSVAPKAEKLPASLGIEGVWRGAQPYIVIRGQRYLVGAVVDGGWAIRGIEHDRVMLEREGRLVAMRF